PERNEISRSADQPPIKTATCLLILPRSRLRRRFAYTTQRTEAELAPHLWALLRPPLPCKCACYATPIRLISHSRSMPECSLTRRRTVSPSVSISAAVALPRLIRKLQCISDTCAPPILRPRQPAASMSCQAL